MIHAARMGMSVASLRAFPFAGTRSLRSNGVDWG